MINMDIYIETRLTGAEDRYCAIRRALADNYAFQTSSSNISNISKRYACPNFGHPALNMEF